MYELFGMVFVMILWASGVIDGSYLALVLFGVMFMAVVLKKKSQPPSISDEWRHPETMTELHQRYAEARAVIADLHESNAAVRKRIDEMRTDFENAFAETERELAEEGMVARSELLDLFDSDRSAFDEALRARRRQRQYPYDGWHRRDPSPDHWTDETPWWTVFGVSRNADRSQVKAAYHDLVRRYHPDNKETGHLDWIKKINIAWGQVKT